MPKPALPPDLIRDLIDLKDQIDRAPHGAGTGLVEGFAARAGRSTSTVYRWLRDYAGYTSGRKKRQDAGTTKMSDETITFIAGCKREGVRANGKDAMPLAVAMNVAAANGHAITLSRSRLGKVLRQRQMDIKTVTAARATGTLRSLHPNHVHQIDPSLCLIYYLRGKQMMMRAEEFYKNKLDAYAKVKLKVWRYVRYDHASGSVDVRYYEAAGEDQANLFDFLLHTWGKVEGRLSHGIPKILMWDKGSANTSHAITRLLDALGVDHITHAAHHAWVKGGVEQANNLVETQFETRLRIEPVTSAEDLNAAAARWVRDYNANAIDHVDCRIRRASGAPMVRDDLWQTILRTPEALVEMPDRKVCQYFMTGRAETRVVRNCKISFRHPELDGSRDYDLSTWAEFLHQGAKVIVSPLLLRDGEVRVRIDRMGADPLLVEVAPEREFDTYGRPLTAQVIGEGYRQMPATGADLAARQLAGAAWGEGTSPEEADKLRAAGGRPFGGAVAHTHLGQDDLPARLTPAARPAQGAALETARAAEVVTRPLTHVEAARHLMRRMGDGWSKDHYQWLVQRYPDGVPEEVLARLADDLAGQKASYARPFTVVEGGA